MTENGSCDGCFMFRDGAWCGLIKSRKDKDCPCGVCLIKVMCRYSCKEYKRYAGTFIEEKTYA